MGYHPRLSVVTLGCETLLFRGKESKSICSLPRRGVVLLSLGGALMQAFSTEYLARSMPVLYLPNLVTVLQLCLSLYTSDPNELEEL